MFCVYYTDGKEKSGLHSSAEGKMIYSAKIEKAETEKVAIKSC